MRHLCQTAFRVVIAGLACTLSAAYAGDSSSSVVVKEYTSPDGQQAYALAIRSNMASHPAIHRHVILVDTSASQTGEVRRSSLKLLSEVLSALPSDHHVQLFAVDTDCEQLTSSWAPVVSKEVNDAFRQLSRRTPLGATNIKSAMAKVADLGSAEAMSVLYIGDGQSPANLLSVKDLDSMTSTLTEKNCSVHTALVGVDVDVELPGIIANLTGGTVREVDPGAEKTRAGEFARALSVAPIAVNDITVDGKTIQLVKRPTFLRRDRHTVMSGVGVLPSYRMITVATDAGPIRYSASETLRSEGGVEVYSLAQRYAESNGVNAPVSSLQMLDQAASQLNQSVARSIEVAQQLQEQGLTRQAAAVASRIADVDSSNPELKTLLTSLTTTGALAQDDSADDNLGPAVQDQADALNDIESQILIRTQRITRATEAAIAEAKEYSYDQPEFSVTVLKDTLETIRAEQNMNPAAKAELERRVRNAIAGIQAQRERNIERQKQVALQEAVKEAQAKLLTQAELEEGRLETLIDQVRGLLERARHGDQNGFEDAEQVSRTAIEMKPGNGAAAAALVLSEASGQLDKARRLVELRHDRFLEVLYQVELSHVPFPDEPPIQYPPADVWRALSLTRKARYESVDLKSEKPIEGWLRRMLDMPVDLSYPGPNVPLKDVLTDIENQITEAYGFAGGGAEYRMTFWPDYAELELDLDPQDPLEDVQINGIEVKGMTLKNALDLIFEQTTDPVKLAYVVDREVMLVTTATKLEDTDAFLRTRVYPVTDLVTPPDLHLQLGGGGQGGQQGGLGGGQQGGGGFGGGGLGGGGQGGGGFGGGGGFMSIPVPEEINLKPQANAKADLSNAMLQNVKKKPVIK